MSTPFRIVTREIARRVNGIAGSQPSPVETNYNTSPLTSTQLDSPVWNLSFIQDLVADVHSDLAMAIASVIDPQTGIGCHPWRSHFRDVTANVGHNSNLPAVGSGGKTIIGALGRPYDAADTDQFLTPASIERVSNYKNNTGVYTNNPSLYHINGSKVYHTTTNIVFECCVYDRSDIATLISTNGSFGTGASSGTVPDALAPALIAGGVVMAVVEGEYAEQVGPFAAYYQTVIESIRAGSIVMPGLPMLRSKVA